MDPHVNGWGNHQPWAPIDQEFFFWNGLMETNYFGLDYDKMRLSKLQHAGTQENIYALNHMDDLILSLTIKQLLDSGESSGRVDSALRQCLDEKSMKELTSRYDRSKGYDQRVKQFFEHLEQTSPQNTIDYDSFTFLLDYMLTLLHHWHKQGYDHINYANPMKYRVYKFILDRKYRFNFDIAHRIQKEYVNRFAPITDGTMKRMEIQTLMIDSVYHAFSRSQVQALDSDRSLRLDDPSWHVHEFVTHDLIEITKGGAWPITDKAEEYYIQLLKKRLNDYSQLEYDEVNTAYTIWEDAIIPDPTILTITTETNDGSNINSILEKLKENHRDGQINEDKIAHVFVWYTLIFATATVYPRSQKETDQFIARRLAEIIRGYPHLDGPIFSNCLTEQLNKLQQIRPYLYIEEPQSRFKTMLIDTILVTFNTLFKAVHSNETTGNSNAQPYYESTSDHTEQPNSQPDSAHGDTQPHHDLPDTHAPPDSMHVPDFLTDDRVMSAVSRYEGPNLENPNITIGQPPYFKVTRPKEVETEMDREVVMAAKRNAQNEYYKEMAKSASDGLKIGPQPLDSKSISSKPFYDAEERLSKIRGGVMRKYITSPSPTTNLNLSPAQQGKYPNIAIELGVFWHQDDGSIIPLFETPMRKIVEHPETRRDIFEGIDNTSHIVAIANIIKEANFQSEYTKFKREHQENSDIKNRINPQAIIENLTHFLTLKKDSAQSYQMKDNNLHLSANIQNWDNSAQTEVRYHDYGIFTFKSLRDGPGTKEVISLPASFQTSLNIPKFPHSELFQSAYTLKKSNLDFHRHLHKSILKYIDLKVRFETTSNQKIELVWTLRRFNPDHYNLVHMAYRSVTPNYTLLTQPTNLVNLIPKANDCIDDSVQIHQTTTKSETLYNADEIKLMQVHAQGVKACVLGECAPTLNTDAFGFIYTYTFWTLIGTCYRIDQEDKNEFFTCYTIIHRTSDLLQDKQRKRPREWDNSSQGSSQTTVPQVIYANQPRVRIIHQKRGMPKGRDWFIFGLEDYRGKDQYIFIPNPGDELRTKLDQATRQLQSKIYKIFYPETIRKSENARKTLTQYINDRLTVELRTQFLTPVPGLFTLWMKQYPKGDRPNELEAIDGIYFTARSFWTHLWETYLPEIGIHNPEKHDMDPHQFDQHLQNFQALYKRNEGQQPGNGRRGPPHHPGGQAQPHPHRGHNQGRPGGRGGAPAKSEFDQAHHGYWLEHDASVQEEDPTQISQMQHEIDTLRRSLNQLALLQG
jgi:hypothetical protein